MLAAPAGSAPTMRVSGHARAPSRDPASQAATADRQHQHVERAGRRRGPAVADGALAGDGAEVVEGVDVRAAVRGRDRRRGGHASS